MRELSGITVLIVDREAAFLGRMQEALSARGARVLGTSALKEAEQVFVSEPVNALLANLELMDESPEAFIRSYKERNPGGVFYLVMEPGTTVTSADPSGLMVDDYLQKPLEPGWLIHMLEEGTTRALAVVDPLVSRSRPYFRFRSEAMRRALADMPRIAASNQTVLIAGETGTGKEIISHAIHVMSPRSAGPFVAVNCSAIPETLIEGELFGHERGAFTGAQSMRKGKFETAHTGTLLLDEIGDMPLNLQSRLLRVLEEGKIWRIGSEKPVPIDVRVIAATRRDLKAAVADGTFREDLYYRLSILRLSLPPLRERVEDVSLLAVYFMDRALAEINARPPYPKLSAAAIALLEKLPWPGNVRELRNVITRVATLLPASAKQVLPMHIIPNLEHNLEQGGAAETKAAEVSQTGLFIPEGSTLEQAERRVIDHALKQTGGNRTHAAKLLGIGLRTIRRKLNEEK